MPRPGIEPGLKIRTKQNQLHQKKVNDFGLFRPTALPQLGHFRLVFRPYLPKFCPRILRPLELQPAMFYAFVGKDTQSHADFSRNFPMAPSSYSNAIRAPMG